MTTTDMRRHEPGNQPPATVITSKPDMSKYVYLGGSTPVTEIQPGDRLDWFNRRLTVVSAQEIDDDVVVHTEERPKPLAYPKHHHRPVWRPKAAACAAQQNGSS